MLASQQSQRLPLKSIQSDSNSYVRAYPFHGYDQFMFEFKYFHPQIFICFPP